MNMDTIPNNLEYWQKVVGSTEDELENENGFFSEKKQLELLEKNDINRIYYAERCAWRESIDRAKSGGNLFIVSSNFFLESSI
ncbi:MAG: hypothetical protein II838_04690 [Lachnospiraceae bacterium]|nr:hypothetical protein [Lachnospiraceae bacterium]